MYMRTLLIILLLGFSQIGVSQEDSTTLQIVLPVGEDWKTVEEGETFKVRVSAQGGKDANYRFNFGSNEGLDMKIDGVGNFRWAVKYEIVSGYNNIEIIPNYFYCRK